MSMIRLDARVSGYKGEAVRLLGACDTNTGAVLVAKVGEYINSGKASADTVIVTDSPNTVTTWQLAYDERQHMLDVIRTYGESKRSGRIRIDKSLLRYNPDAIVQQRKIGDSGTVWEFDSQSTENGHVAVMLMVWAASRAIRGDEQMAMMDGDDAPGDDEDDCLPFSL